MGFDIQYVITGARSRYKTSDAISLDLMAQKLTEEQWSTVVAVIKRFDKSNEVERLANEFADKSSGVLGRQ